MMQIVNRVRSAFSTFPRFAALGMIPALLALLFVGCGEESTGGSDQPFAVQFTVAAVPRGLPLDSIEIHITIGDTGSPQSFTIDTKNGVSKATVQAYPGQEYTLTYKFFSGGFAIGSGALSGVLEKNLAIALAPEWDQAKVDLAYASVNSGKFLPPYLETTFNLALAGKPLNLQIDSAGGKTYQWFVRLDDSVIADGVGARIAWVPDDSLAGGKVNIKIQVLNGSTIVEERKWDIQIIATRAGDRLVGIVTKNDTASNHGSLTYFKYTGSGNRDSVLVFDTISYVSGRPPVASIAYAYQTISARDYVQKASTVYVTGESTDSSFSYDSQGRLATVSVTLKSGTTVDSLDYGANGTVTTRSYAQGRLTRVLKHVKLPGGETADTSFSRSDTAMAVSRVVRSVWQEERLVSTRTFVNKAGLTLNASERFVYNGLGYLALHFFYSESGSPELVKTETFTYNPAGLLSRVIVRDESAGEVERAQYFEYGTEVSPAPKVTATQAENRGWLLRLGQPGSAPVLIPGLRRAPIMTSPWLKLIP